MPSLLPPYGNAERIDEAIHWMEIASREHPFFHAKNNHIFPMHCGIARGFKRWLKK